MLNWIDYHDKIDFLQSTGKIRPKYHIYCSTCGKSRGYKLLQNAKTHPNCNACARALDKERRVQHWKKYFESNVPWNKGKNGLLSNESRKRISFHSSNRSYTEKHKKQIKIKKQITHATKQGYSSLREYLLAKRLKRNLRSRLNKAITSNAKQSSAVDSLGCTLAEFKVYLEAKFQPGMTWDNYGEWEIDHIVPLNQFNMLLLEEQRKACHYSNLQPLWKVDNLRKRFTDGTFTATRNTIKSSS